ncbi:MAG: hypothetical protein MJ102_02955 [Clostridia bacterium]|nr:hypothetical protein [Clostridia bacterium]
MYFLGIDIGSTAVKACIIRASAKSRINNPDNGIKDAVVARGSADYPTARPLPDHATHDPRDWNRATAAAVRQAVDSLPEGAAAEIGGICFSAQGGSIYAADADNQPLCDALTWMDRRAVKESADVIAEPTLGFDKIRSACGWRPAPTDCIAKLLWLRRNEPDMFARAAHFYTTEESVTGYLTGNFVTDATGEVMTRLYDYRAGKYIPEALDFLGITEDQLPRVLPCGSPAGKLLPETAAEFGIPAGIPVFVGAHDQYCASIGSGVTEPGQLLLATGTAWVMFGVSEKPLTAPPYPAPCTHPIEGRFGVMSSMAGCGGALGAYAAACGTKASGLDRRIEDEGVGNAREKCRDLFVCPLPPEPAIAHRSGVCVPLATAGGHSEAHTALAAMEGAAFEARILAEAFESAGFPRGGQLVMSGGASKSPLWRSIVASVFSDRPLYILCEADAPALGAALLAAQSAGAYATLADAAGALCERISVPCDADAADFYRNKYRSYREWALA